MCPASQPASQSLGLLVAGHLVLLVQVGAVGEALNWRGRLEALLLRNVLELLLLLLLLLWCAS